MFTHTFEGGGENVLLSYHSLLVIHIQIQLYNSISVYGECLLYVYVQVSLSIMNIIQVGISYFYNRGQYMNVTRDG